MYISPKFGTYNELGLSYKEKAAKWYLVTAQSAKFGQSVFVAQKVREHMKT
jgi:hypothetical protein